jgi:hypothetical protein
MHPLRQVEGLRQLADAAGTQLATTQAQLKQLQADKEQLQADKERQERRLSGQVQDAQVIRGARAQARTESD